MAAAQNTFDLQKLLVNDKRDFLVNKAGDKVPVSSLKDKTVGLYFSAHWCPPCRGFTPALAKVYQELQEKKAPFEVVFISSDSDEKGFQDYLKEMPWVAVPFDERSIKAKLSELFHVEGIPTLVMLAPDGSMITDDARSAVAGTGAAGFPWKPKMVAEVDERLDALNKGPCVLALLEDAKPEEQKSIQEQMKAVEEDAALSKGVTFLYATKHSPMVTRVRQFFALEVATNVLHEHPLADAEKSGWQCDVCAKVFRTLAKDHECRKCNYDECEDCFTKRKSAGPRALLAPRLLLLDSEHRSKFDYASPLAADAVRTFVKQWRDGTAHKFVKSAPRPANDADPEHPGLTVVVSSSFAEICLNPNQSVFLDVYADWCGPCMAFKPELLKAAQVLHDMKVKNLLVGSLDCDKNDTDAKYLPETTIPNIKLFHRGKDPIKFPGPRTAIGVLEFIHKNVAGTDSEFDLEQAKAKLAALPPPKEQSCCGGTCGGDCNECDGDCGDCDAGDDE